MYHVLELRHNNIVFSGQLSQATGYVIEHYGKQLDEAIRSGIRILDTDALRGLNEVQQTVRGSQVPKFRHPIDDLEVV
jgi:hypothetical protein